MVANLVANHCDRLTDKHTGLYLAKVTADCLKRFGLEKKVFTVYTAHI